MATARENCWMTCGRGNGTDAARKKGVKEMDACRMLDIMGGIDEKFIEEAEEAATPSHYKWFGVATAACLCLLAGTAWMKAGMARRVAFEAQQEATQNETWEVMREEMRESAIPSRDPAETEEMAMEMEGSPESILVEEGEIDQGLQQTERAVQENNNGSAESMGDAQDVNHRTEENANDPMFTDDKEIASKTKMITSYPVDGPDVEGLSGDYAVLNGGCFLSPSLKGALAEYGNSEEYRYRVIIELFRDGVQVPNESDEAGAERDRLATEGYVVAYETLSDGNATTHSLFTIHATAKQLKEFATSQQYGYGLWLYDEKEGHATEGTVETYDQGYF